MYCEELHRVVSLQLILGYYYHSVRFGKLVFSIIAP